MTSSLLAYMSAACLVLGWAPPAQAQSGPAPAAPQGALEAWASFILAPKVWKGQMVPWPDSVPRPASVSRLDSAWLPVHVHGPASSARRLPLVLAALEQAYTLAAAQGWPLPYADGGAGGTPGFDLYLAPAARAPAYAGIDGPIAWSDFDAAQTYAVVDAGLSDSQLPACVLAAYVQAALRGTDPSEAESLVRATGDFAAWNMLGELGCADAFVSAQRKPEAALLDSSPESGAAGGLFFAVLSERHDGGSGAFIRALWELTRQRSAGLVEPGLLRSSPDVWEVLALAAHTAQEDLDDLLEDFSVARYFAGRATRARTAPYQVLRALPVEVPLLAEVRDSELPKHARSVGEGLAALGSAYARVTVDSAASSELRVWLRGEIGPRWSLVAVRLAADGGELGRVIAPRRNVPESYLPVLLTPDTKQVLVVVTYLLEKKPEADRIPPSHHGFELIFDRTPSARQ